MKLNGNVETVLPWQNAGYTYLWSDKALDLQQAGRRSGMPRDGAGNANVRDLVSILYARLFPAPEVMKQHYENLQNVVRSQNDPNKATKNVEANGIANPDDMIDVEGYRVTPNVCPGTNISGGPLSENKPGLPTVWRLFNVF